MHMNAASWRPWIGEPAELRERLHPGLGALTFGAVARELAAFVEALPEPPILIGHSVGGLLVQKLINDGRGRLGVAISPAPPRGILSVDPHFLRANLPLHRRFRHDRRRRRRSVREVCRA